MRNLEVQEMGLVSGGFEWEINGVLIKLRGDETDIAAAYDWAVDKTADFLTWWDPMGYYDNRC